MLNYAKFQDVEKVPCASFMLRNDAEYWWDTMGSVHDVTTMTWDRFKELFYNKYFSDAIRASRRAEFVNLK